jgi:hypothetical protein
MNLRCLIFFLFYFIVMPLRGHSTVKSMSDSTGYGRFAPQSVLAAGTWYKLAIPVAGVYKIDIPFLKNIGINTDGLSSASIQLYGSGGQMLPEPNNEARADDMPEVAIQVVDGGDGVLDGADYILFYAPGPHSWSYLPATNQYKHQYNLYSDTAYYFLTIGNQGQRIPVSTNILPATTTVNTFDYHAFYEQDSVNLLSSGKQWWGPLFGNMPGGVMQRNFYFSLPATPAEQIKLTASAAARGGSTSRFECSINGNIAGYLDLGPVNGNIFEAVATATAGTFTGSGNAANVTVGLSFVPGGNDARGWLDYLEVQTRCPLVVPTNTPLFFRDTKSIAPGGNARFLLQNTTAQTQVWDVTMAGAPVQVKTTQEGTNRAFVRSCTELREYVAFDNNGLMQPAFSGVVARQNLHGEPPAAMLIITVPAFLSAANRLASYHQAHDGLEVRVTLVQDIYHEFAAGNPDPVAIRDYVKMHYTRGGGKLKYLLLFGAASFDYKNRIKNNTSLVPSWQSRASLDPINSYVSDDFFGLLEATGDIEQPGAMHLMNIGIGRIPVRNVEAADKVVDKIMGYHTPTSFGAWRNKVTLVADDEDNNLHFSDAEAMGAVIGMADQGLNIDKIYLDAYEMEADPGGSRYPAVNTAINQRMQSGNLIWNYSGHGSNSRLAAEAVVDENSLKSWNNEHKLPLMITATCDFIPFDNPAITSLGEKILLTEKGGAIGLMSTTRSVFAASNKVMNANYFKAALTPIDDGRMPSLGAAIREAKNTTTLQREDMVNNRKFQLIGDPALTLAFPELKVITDSINGIAVGAGTDTLKALGRYVIKGHVETVDGLPLNSYGGILYTTVYDKPAIKRTLGNQGSSYPVDFALQQHILFKGAQTVQNGMFTITFVVPKDIDYRSGPGNISYYTANETQDGGGVFNRAMVGGAVENAADDSEGPFIKAYLDDPFFKDGGITGENPTLIAELRDTSGINASGYGIGHDMVATLDDGAQYFILNDYFEASLNSYSRGVIRFPLQNLPVGPHVLTIKAWDAHNNSNSVKVHFTVVKASALVVQAVNTYPNPFQDVTRFVFTHNQQGQELDIRIEIYNSSGQRVKTTRQTINATGSRFDGVLWNGTGDNGAKLSQGVYFYKITVKGNGNEKVLGGKLLLL